MKEFEFYIGMIKNVIDMDELKETVFYDSGEWYSRRHSRKITLDELKEMVLDISTQNYKSNELWERVESFISDNFGDEYIDQFWKENEDLQ